MARDQRLARVFVLCLFIIVVLSASFTVSIQLSIDPAFAKGGGGGGAGGRRDPAEAAPATEIPGVMQTMARAEVR